MGDIETALERWTDYAIKHGECQDWTCETGDIPIIRYAIIGCGHTLSWARFDAEGWRDDAKGEYSLVDDSEGFIEAPFSAEARLLLWAHRELVRRGYVIEISDPTAEPMPYDSLYVTVTITDVVTRTGLVFDCLTLLGCYLDAIKATEKKT